MDVWNIYSVGDAHFLSQVLNAVAAICGTSDFSTACAVALLVGVIIICVQTVISGRGLPIQTAAVCYLFWMICYFPTVSVNIHDVYTQQDRKVDNVPLGPAVIGSVVSTFGFKVTEMMETAFQMPTATATLTGSGDGAGGRYANALYYLNSVIRLGNDPVLSKSIDEINNDQRGDFTRSLGDYVRYCTFRAVQLGPQWGGKTISQINELPISQALAFNSDVYYTQVWQNGTPRDYTCGDAWEILYDKTTNTFRGGVNSEALTQLAVKLGGVQDKDPNLTWNYAQAVDVGVETADALEALRIDATNAQDFMLTSLAYDIFRAGMARGYSDYHDRTTAVAINQAIAQRNMQWASEQTMFFDTMRPIMSFIEGFVYAITPFAGFIMLLGVFGLKLFFKYFMLLVWIQLWLPVIAICNMFIMSGATRELSEFSAGGLNPTSFYALDHISQTVSTWIATGGMFAAATPLLTFIIVSGSAFAITSLTGRLNGADHFNEKIASPDVVTPGSALAMQAKYSGDSFKAQLSGSDALTPNINLSEIAQSSAQRAHQDAFNASKQFRDSFSSAVGLQGSNLSSTTQSALFSESVNAARTHGISAAVQEVMGNSVAQQAGVSQSQARDLAVGLSLGFMAKGSAQSKTANGSSLQSVFDKMKSDNFSFSENAASQVSRATASAYNKMSSQGETFGLSTQTQRSLSNEASKVLSTAETATQMDQLASSIGLSNSVSLIAAAGSMTQAEKASFNKNYENFRQSLSNADRQVLDAGEASFISKNGDAFSTNPEAGKLNALLTYYNAEGKDETLEAKRIALSSLGHVPMMNNASELYGGTYENANSNINGYVPKVGGGVYAGTAYSTHVHEAQVPQATATEQVQPVSTPATPDQSTVSAEPVKSPSSGDPRVPASPNLAAPSAAAAGATMPEFPTANQLQNLSPTAFSSLQGSLMQQTKENAVSDLKADNVENNQNVAHIGDQNNSELRAAREPIRKDALNTLNELRVFRGNRTDEKLNPEETRSAVEQGIIGLMGKLGLYDPGETTTGRNYDAATVLANKDITDNFNMQGLDFEQNLKNLYNSASIYARNVDGAVDILSMSTKDALDPSNAKIDEINFSSDSNVAKIQGAARSTYDTLMSSRDFDRLTTSMGLDNNEKENYARDLVSMTVSAGSGSLSDKEQLLLTTNNMGIAGK